MTTTVNRKLSREYQCQISTPIFNEKNELMIASDRSKTRTKSGGGWVIATKDGTIIVRGSNPEFGQLGKIHSYRSEVYASLASQLFITTYAECFNIIIESKITSYCDNRPI